MNIILALLVVLGQTVQTITGFGSSAIVLSVGANLFPVDRLIIVLVMLSLVQVSWLAIRGRQFIQWSFLLKKIFPIAALVMPIGMLLYYRVDASKLKVLLGVFIVAASGSELYRLLRNKAPSGPLGPVAGTAVLAAASFIHGLFATGGPLMVYFASREIDAKRDFRATLAAMWLVLNTVLLTTFALKGRITEEVISTWVYLFPALIFGIVIGEYLHHVVNEALFKKVVQAVLFLSGLFLLISI